jgi:hypothetical protein
MSRVTCIMFLSQRGSSEIEKLHCCTVDVVLRCFRSRPFFSAGALSVLDLAVTSGGIGASWRANVDRLHGVALDCHVQSSQQLYNSKISADKLVADSWERMYIYSGEPVGCQGRSPLQTIKCGLNGPQRDLALMPVGETISQLQLLEWLWGMSWD